MTNPANTATEARRPIRRARGRLGAALAVLLAVSTLLAATLLWADRYVFEARNFAARADSSLDSPAVRRVLTDQITEAIVQASPSQVASFQTVIRPVIETFLTTPAARRMFQRGLEEIHTSLFTRSGNAAIVNFSQALAVLSASLQVSNPDVADLLPPDSDRLFVDLGNEIRGLRAWRFAHDVSTYGWLFLALTIALALGTVVVDDDRRRGTFRLGLAIVVAGVAAFALALVAPVIAGSYTDNAEMARAVNEATTSFLGDYRTGALWLVAIGAAVAGFASASRPRSAPTTVRGIIELARARVSPLLPDTVRTRTIAALALLAAGGAMLAWTDLVLRLLVLMVAGLLLYLGSVRLLTIVGRVDTPSVHGESSDELRERAWRPGLLRLSLGAAVVLAVLVIGGLWSTSGARARAIADHERRCNGSASLCDRRLDEVAFAGAHNAMSAATDPGWLFYEQGHGIPAQLDAGVRALLMKTHYGIRTTIRVTGADLVLTDRTAELAVDPTLEQDQLSPEQRQQLQRLQSSVSSVDPSLRDVYLCHVNCEFGATRFVTALGYVHQFLARNPDEVVILFIGDYVSKADTERAFREARLLDRLWEYDPSAPMPTLGELIDSGRNVIYLAEFSGQPPAWNVPGYGIFQDTPFTFPTIEPLLTPGAPGYRGDATVTGPVDATTTPPDGGPPVFTRDWTGLPSCAPNRGTPASPLFQINHWVTPVGAASTVEQARIVNSYDVLMPAVRNCMAQRARFPTIVGVNFAEVGDLQRVVAELNGVSGG